MSKSETCKNKLVIHYSRPDKDYSLWSVWLWEFPNGQGKEYSFTGEDDFGAIIEIDLKNYSKNVLTNNFGLIVKSKGSWICKDGKFDRKVIFSKLSLEKGKYHIYIKSGDDALYKSAKLDNVDIFEYAKFTSFNSVEIKTTSPIKELKIEKDLKPIAVVKQSVPSTFFVVKFDEPVTFGSSYLVSTIVNNGKSRLTQPISTRTLYKTYEFKEKFTYSGDDLGVTFTSKSTTFKVWSPVSRKIVLRVYKSGTPTYYDRKLGNDEIILEAKMKKDSKGVFSYKVDKNLHGYYYTYKVTNDFYKEKEITDIYAKSGGVNGLRGMIVDFSKIKVNGFEKVTPHIIKPGHLVAYEVHIADLTSSPTWTSDKKARKLEKTFIGACLEGTTYYQGGKTVKTGFDHIKELGVNAVQLMPIFDHSNDETHMKFNWGYDPVNFNILEGGFSTNPYDGITRIVEFKTLVKKYHDAGINIIMDVVYNHVYGASGCNFEVLMPGYYFRTNDNGEFSNASGCGNETASEMPMMRKFMIDSLMFLANEYKLGGFRFDLMGIHDIETMNEIAKTLHSYNKDLILYGEPWYCLPPNYPAHKLAIKDNAYKFEGFGFFNDGVRDALLRESCARVYAGWCGNSFTDSPLELECISNAIKGISNNVTDPSMILNYASCHDNRTLYDKLMYCDIDDEREAKKIAMLVNSIILTSNGMSFILAGEEFLRTKGGCENSYNSPYEVNALDYSLKLKNNDMFLLYQKLIHLKENVSDLALTKENNKQLVVDTSEPNVIYYELYDEITKRTYVVYHLNGYKNGKNCIVNLEGYKLYLDTINPHKQLSSKTSLIAYETLIAYKE